MTREALEALAARCEQATGPSRHLDTQIHILLDPDAQHIVGRKRGRFPQEAIYGPRSTFWEWACDETKEPPAYAAIPEFTASVDAALTLVPEGWDRSVLDMEDGRAFVVLSKGEADEQAIAATWTLAITAAALRAHAAKEGLASERT